ncbi:cyclin-domain-containing protein, partial [Glonium stellatum]
PPSPPNPSADEGVIPPIASPDRFAPSPPADGEWDVASISPETAMKMLWRSVQALANATGDIPPTPPIGRPTTPGGFYRTKSKENFRHHHRRTSSRPATPVPSDDLKALTFKSVEIGSPEALMSEPSVADVGANAEPVHIQQEAIARKFFSKKAPHVSLEEYLLRLQRYCPMSTAVYLAAGVYIHKLAVEERLVPVTTRTVHRLVLASLRVAMKALEDLRYPQARFAGVGGVGENELKMLEISLCYLTNFDLQVNPETLYQKTLCLQKAAQSAAVCSKVPPSFQPRLPS